jgi:hypothetical protein
MLCITVQKDEVHSVPSHWNLFLTEIIKHAHKIHEADSNFILTGVFDTHTIEPH